MLALVVCFGSYSVVLCPRDFSVFMSGVLGFWESGQPPLHLCFLRNTLGISLKSVTGVHMYT